MDVGAVDDIIEALHDYVRDGGAVVAPTSTETLGWVADRVLGLQEGHLIDELVGDLITPRERLVHSYGRAAAKTLLPPEAANATAAATPPEPS